MIQENDNREQITRVRMRINAARRARAAVGFAAVTFLTVISVLAYRLFVENHPNSIQVVLVMALAGFIMLNIGRAKSRRLGELAILRFYRSFRFYGSVTTISSLLVLGYALTHDPAPHVRARAMPAPAPDPVKPVAETTAPEFPNLSVTGVILDGTNSSAIINNRTVPVGGRVEGVRLVEVGENHVVVERDGYTKKVSRLIAPPKPDSKRPGKKTK